MTHRAHKFRVRYFGQFGPLHDVEITAQDAATAVGVAGEAQRPPKAIGFRIVDVDGREVFEGLRADRR
jgi:hypothetical protein